jgi:hypothetical protein
VLPVTLIDGYGRYLLRCETTSSPTEGFVRTVLESAFANSDCLRGCGPITARRSRHRQSVA